MEETTLPASGHMMFSGSGARKIKFGGTDRRLPRVVTHLYITTSGSATISFDGGQNYMDLADGTHVFPYPHVAEVVFGQGTWSGVGISI